MNLKKMRMASEQVRELFIMQGIEQELWGEFFLRGSVLFYAREKGFYDGGESGLAWLERELPSAFNHLGRAEADRFAGMENLLTTVFIRHLGEKTLKSPGELGELYEAFLYEDKTRIYRHIRNSGKLTAEDLPAATQLFTPRWLASYMAENTIGTWWLTVKPDSVLNEEMPYLLKTGCRGKSYFSLKDMTVLDPACGSGQLLLAAFDLLFRIYLERGESSGTITETIIRDHLHGWDIDARILQLAKASLLLRGRELSGAFCRSPDWSGFRNVAAEEHGSLAGKNQGRTGYAVVLANPPYMGTKAMSPELKIFLKKMYPDTHYDLYAAFMERVFDLTRDGGWSACLAQQSWMYLKSYERLRRRILKERQVQSLLHLGTGAFDTISGEVVQTAAWVMRAVKPCSGETPFYDLTDGKHGRIKEEMFLLGSGRHDRDQALFDDLPGAAFSYSVRREVARAFIHFPSMSETALVRKGMFTGNNRHFLRKWYEVPAHLIGRDFSSLEEALSSDCCWFPVKKGGPFRRWSGNGDWVLRLDRDSYAQIASAKGHRSPKLYFSPAVTWSKVTTKDLSCRYAPSGFINNDASMAVYEKEVPLLYLTALLNSSSANVLLRTVSATLNYSGGDLGKMPVALPGKLELNSVTGLVRQNIGLTQWEERFRETSPDFTGHPVLTFAEPGAELNSVYRAYAAAVEQKRAQLAHNEDILNRFFAKKYGFTDFVPVTPEENLLSIRKPCPVQFASGLISFVLGVCFGRWRVPGQEPAAAVCLADRGGLLVRLVREYLGTLGVSNSLEWLANTLGSSRGKTVDEAVARYIEKKFYSDHLKVYERRPIYWPVQNGDTMIWFYYQGLKGAASAELEAEGCPSPLAKAVSGLLKPDEDDIPASIERFRAAVQEGEKAGV
ncbi:Eco57I restriction-modification methylase domain-containing protein [Alteribacter natronophilus]|uniref:Eco57I restriction-modification methylase domain-containing protein n=1 Tax=Alteribacter natronophilus TaxID=2583810 RepID=UPI00110EDF4F|nr:N-6 DNA methylase [Alteribacter natronophilus]TMW70667.1 hypothetical protein FGB90_15915 [Alteribacter natronophilus]